MIEKIKKIAIMQWILLRYCYYFFYVKAKKIDNTDTWLISERGTDSRDNAYHLFRYIRENYPDCNIKYVIDNNSADYQKIKNLGNTVNFRSKEHFIYFLTAGKLISTHIMGFSPDMSLFSRLDNLNLLRIKGKRVFLQHGVTQNKVFSRTKVHLFLCSSQKEYNFLKNVCNVNKDVLKCIGMPRFDKLVSHANKSNKKILLMPTFRKWLNYVEDFKSTE